ncbi:hypothetical protein BDK51DRAFT_2602, partial [Blyttiomyces helicus]
LSSRFKMTDAGEVHHCLNLLVTCHCAALTFRLTQITYNKDIMTAAGLNNLYKVSTSLSASIRLLLSDMAANSDFLADPLYYKHILGQLMFTTVATCRDLASATSALNQYASKPDNAPDSALHHILRYIKGT